LLIFKEIVIKKCTFSLLFHVIFLKIILEQSKKIFRKI
jgi:hypothetical protein